MKFYILVISKVISGWIPTCHSAHSWWLYSAAPLGNHEIPLSRIIMTLSEPVHSTSYYCHATGSEPASFNVVSHSFNSTAIQPPHRLHVRLDSAIIRVKMLAAVRGCLSSLSAPPASCAAAAHVHLSHSCLLPTWPFVKAYFGSGVKPHPPQQTW